MRKIYCTLIYTFLCLFFLSHNSFADNIYIYNRIIPDATEGENKKLINKRYIKKLYKKTKKYRKRVERNKLIYTRKLERSEKKVARALRKENPPLANHFFNKSFRENVADRKQIYYDKVDYHPSIDSLRNILLFIRENPQHHDGTLNERNLEKIDEELLKLTSLMKEIGEMKIYGNTRKKQFSAIAKKYPIINNKSKSFEKDHYYFHAQVREYNNLFRNVSKFEDKVLKKLSYQTQFSKFLKDTSLKQQVFSVPMVKDINMPGVQTNKILDEHMQSNIKKLGSYAKEVIAGNMAEMKKELTKAKYLTSSTNSGSFAEQPGFKPNPLKTKRFVDRLTFSPDVQVNHKRGNTKASINAGLGIGYKISPRFISGVSLNYKIGLEGNLESMIFNNPLLSSSLYTEYKIKRIYYHYTAYERNITRQKFDPDRYIGKPQPDSYILSGLKIKYPLKGKKYKACVSLLYDFTHNQHFNKQSPIIYRIGWEF